MRVKSTLGTFLSRSLIIWLNIFAAIFTSNLTPITIGKLNSKDVFLIKAEDFSFTSPVFLGSVGGGVLLIIVGIILYCVCRKKPEAIPENHSDGEKCQQIEAKDPSINGRPESPEKMSLTKGI
jgi:hypothetical protein